MVAVVIENTPFSSVSRLDHHVSGIMGNPLTDAMLYRDLPVIVGLVLGREHVMYLSILEAIVSFNHVTTVQAVKYRCITRPLSMGIRLL